MHVQAIAAAVIKGDCYSSDAKTTVLAATGGDYGLIEGCHKDGYAHGYGKGSTKGSDTGGVRSTAVTTCQSLSRSSSNSQHFLGLSLHCQ